MANFREFFKEVGDVVGDRTGLYDLRRGLTEGNPALVNEGLQTLRRGPRPYIDDDPIRDSFIASNSSYSGSDCLPIADVNGHLIVLGSVETFSYSILREKSPVRTLGRSYPKGYTGGPRTIAGSMVFVVFDRHPMYSIISALKNEPRSQSDRYSSPVADQIPPIDLTLWFSNEYGHKSILRLYGVEFFQEGQVHSVNDIYSESTLQYYARDMDVLMQYRDIEGFRNLMYERQIQGQFTDNRLAAMLGYRNKILRELQNVESLIQKMNLEKGKRGIVTFGISSLIGNRDIESELERLESKKISLTQELNNIQLEISDHSENLYGFDPEKRAEGGMGWDNLRQAPVI